MTIIVCTVVCNYYRIWLVASVTNYLLAYYVVVLKPCIIVLKLNSQNYICTQIKLGTNRAI